MEPSIQNQAVRDIDEENKSLRKENKILRRELHHFSRRLAQLSAGFDEKMVEIRKIAKSFGFFGSAEMASISDLENELLGDKDFAQYHEKIQMHREQQATDASRLAYIRQIHYEYSVKQIPGRLIHLDNLIRLTGLQGDAAEQTRYRKEAEQLRKEWKVRDAYAPGSIAKMDDRSFHDFYEQTMTSGKYNSDVEVQILMDEYEQRSKKNPVLFSY